MNILKAILFFISLIAFSQESKLEIINLHLYECIDQSPGDYIYISSVSLRHYQSQFFKQNKDFKPGDWELNGSIYRTADDANSNSNPDPYNFDFGSKSYLVPYNNPFIIYLRLNKISMPPIENGEYYVIKLIVNYNKRPQVINTTLEGCVIDENKYKFNLNNDYLIKEYRSNPMLNPYNFEIFRNMSDIHPVPESEWETFILLNGESNKLYVKVTYKDTENKCFKFYTITLESVDYSTQMEQTEFEFCGNPFIISGPEDQQNYEWYYDGELKSSDRSVEINALGEWIVYFENDLGCRSSVEVNIVSEKERARIEKVTATSNTITIIPLPNANIDSYSLDGVNYQTSRTFYNQTADVINIWYKTKLGCVFGPIPFEIANSFNFLSPNGDGVNDTWNLRNKEFYNSAKIQIFDRFGKIVANGIVNDILPWNGKHNNFILPSGTYWFIIKDDKETLKTGYIILKSM